MNDGRIAWLAYAAVARRLAELVTRLANGEKLSKGEIKRYAACVPSKYQTPDLRKFLTGL